MEWITTTLILEQMRGFDERAWSEFCQRFHEPLVHFARSMGLAVVDAEDVAQETLATFAHTFRDGRYDSDRGRLSSWLFGIAHNKVLQQREALLRRRRVDGPASPRSSFWSAVPDEASARETWAQAWEWTLLQRCLKQVEKEVKTSTMQAFRMLALEQRPISEVAGALDMTENAATVAKHRVLKRVRELQKLLEGEDD